MSDTPPVSDICFLDTECLGLHPDAPVWEFATIRRSGSNRNETRLEFFIQHDSDSWLEDFPEDFARDYRTRYDETHAWNERAAASAIHTITRGAHIIGAVPSFDTERLAKLLRRNGIEPEWHYHLIDVENVAVGFLAGRSRLLWSDALRPPYDSNELSRGIGVEPDQYARHTAMGDVLWVRAQWDAVIGVGEEAHD